MSITRTRSFVLLTFGALFGIGVVHCAVTAAPPNTDQASATIGNVGGVVSTANGSVAIPPGALQSEVTIVVEDVPNAPLLTQGTPVGPAIRCEPEGTTFSDPVTITLGFKKSLLPAGKTVSDIVIYTAPAGSPDYVGLVTSLSSDGQHVVAQTTHFSYFVPIVPGPQQPRPDSGQVDSMAPPDSTVPTDTSPPPKDAKPPKDTGTVDSTVGPDGADTGASADSAMDSAMPVDTSTPDTGTVTDTGAADTGAPDTGAPDTGAPDTGAPDTGAPDAGDDAADASD